VVAVLDSGIQPHPDLQPRYLGGYDFITADDNAADNQPGRDSDPTDTGTTDQASSQLHGMHVAGIVGAHTDNAVGMAGVDWSCKLLPVRVLGTLGGAGQDSDIADAIRWAAGLHVDGVPDNANPAQVINMSFGAPGGSGLLQSAIDDVDALGVIVVSAAGNDGGDTAMYAPAGLNHVIAVGASDATGGITFYSNRGPRLDLLAPGGDLTVDSGIVSTMFDETDGFTYVALNGTSQASPHVAGVAALMKAIDPLIGGARARMILTSTADPAHQCADGCGGGLLDADAAVAAVQAGCADGHCNPAPNGFDLQGGCAIGGRARPLGLGWLAAAVALACALRRGSRRRGFRA
jgi:serine protease